MDNIPNFDKLTELLKQYNAASDEDAVWLIHEMQDLEGYYEWLAWMEKNKPEELP